jgi:hypothetical protein
MSTPSTTRFPDKNELKRFARRFVKERMDSLEKDVIHCLRQPFAPFPAILYCISTIDLLGALSAGQAAKKDPITNKSVDTIANSKIYMQKFMGYTVDQTNLVTDLFSWLPLLTHYIGYIQKYTRLRPCNNYYD